MNKVILIIIVLFVSLQNISFSQPITWERIFDEDSEFNRAVEIGNQYIVTGSKRIGNYSKFYTVKLSSSGDTLWSFLFDNSANANYNSFWIEQTQGNGFIISGDGTPGAFPDAYLVKINSNGSLEWWKSFEGGNRERGIFVKQTPDLGYGLLVYTYIPSDILFVKTDSLGDLQWQKFYDSGIEDGPRGFCQINNNGYLILSSSSIEDSLYYMYLLRINNSGDTIWTKKNNYNYKRTSYNSIDKISENEIIIGGMSAIGHSFVFDSTLVIKMDTSGNVQWQKKYSSFSREFCNSISNVPGRGIIIAGQAGDEFASENGMLRLLNYEGDIIFEKFYTYPNSKTNVFESVSPCSDKGFIISGYVTINDGGPRAYILKTDSIGNLKSVNIENNFQVVNKYELYQNYPNPFNPSTVISYYLPFTGNVRLTIYDIRGREIAILVNQKQHAGKHNIEWNAVNYNSGVYFCKLETEKFVDSKKIVFLK